VARNDFNGVVGGYNNSVQTFPAVLFASVLGFPSKPFFQASQAAQNAPSVNFDTK
jgi:LemA protein